MMAGKLKFGSVAWRKKYVKNPKRKRTAKRKSTSHSRGTAYKKKRLKEMIRESKNPASILKKIKALVRKVK